METNPFFSVIIPLHNKASHIQRALNSVFKQDFTDYEVIIINDASTDSSREISEKAIAGSSHCRIIDREKPGRGGYAARNLGARESKAAWLAFLDADDEWLPGHLADLTDIIKKYPSARFCCTGVKEILPDGTEFHNGYLKHPTRIDGEIDIVEYAMMASQGRNPLFTSACAVHREFFIAVGGFPENGFGRGGDRETWIRLLSKTTLGYMCNVSAIYHRDAENMVTKTVPFDIQLSMDGTVRSLIAEYTKKRNNPAASALKKMLNYEKKRPIRRMLEKGNLSPKIVNELYFDADPFYFLATLLLSLMPSSVQVFLLSKKRGII